MIYRTSFQSPGILLYLSRKDYQLLESYVPLDTRILRQFQIYLLRFRPRWSQCLDLKSNSFETKITIGVQQEYQTYSPFIVLNFQEDVSMSFDEQNGHLLVKRKPQQQQCICKNI